MNRIKYSVYYYLRYLISLIRLYFGNLNHSSEFAITDNFENSLNYIMLNNRAILLDQAWQNQPETSKNALPDLYIENEVDIGLSFDVSALLKMMFFNYRKVTIKKRFSRGWSGAIVFQVEPFAHNSSIPELNRVVKIGEKSLIFDEYDAYLSWIKNRLPKASELLGSPISDPYLKKGVLKYKLVGDGIYEVYSLGQSFNSIPSEIMFETIPSWLFPALESLWLDTSTNGDYSLKEGFNYWLPYDLEDYFSEIKIVFNTYLPEINLESDSVSVGESLQFKNPLFFLDEILNQSIIVNECPIHGDLNLENILITKSGAAYDLQFIDFARSRKDYVLHDLLSLEVSVLIDVLPSLISSQPNSIELLFELLLNLDLAINNTNIDIKVDSSIEKPFRFLLVCRSRFKHQLKRPNNWENYYKCLILCLSGALLFKNEEKNDLEQALSYKIAFWGATFVYHVLNNQVYSEIFVNNPV